MTKRERMLAAMVGVLILLGGLFYSFQTLTRNVSAKRTQLRGLQSELDDKRRTVRFSQPAADRMRLYERRALPGDVEKARSLYQTWLLKSVTNVGFQEPNVKSISATSSRDLYHQLGFTISGRGNLQQLTEFLHAFYAADYLHRIRRLHVKQVAGTKNLDVSMAVEALSLPTANHVDGLSEYDSGRLAYGDLPAYLDRILSRNLSGPPNQPPQIQAISDRNATTGSSVSFTVNARDPDRLDRIRFSMDASGVPGARLDPRSGQFSWQPQRPGDYHVVFTATDDGLPAKSHSQRVRIVVNDPPPPARPVEVVRKPSFDMAKFAYVTAITSSGGQPQTWISLRTEGKMLRLGEGDQFHVGEVPVTVQRIHDRTVELEATLLDKRFRVGLGQSLAEGNDIARSVSVGEMAQDMGG